MITAGIDPGKRGAFAFCVDGRLASICDMPIAANEVDAAILSTELQRLCPDQPPPTLTVIENQQAMPKQGVSSCFKIGRRFGIVLGVCGALGWPIELVQPTRWKGALKLVADKDAARARASQLMPEGAHWWTRKMDDGRAEAALLAWYAAMLVRNQALTAA